MGLGPVFVSSACSSPSSYSLHAQPACCPASLLPWSSAILLLAPHACPLGTSPTFVLKLGCWPFHPSTQT